MFDEYQNLTLFEETATTPTSLVALNIALWFGCQPDKAASCSDAVQAFLQSELEDTDFTNVIIPPELWLDHWHSRFSAHEKVTDCYTDVQRLVGGGRIISTSGFAHLVLVKCQCNF